MQMSTRSVLRAIREATGPGLRGRDPEEILSEASPMLRVQRPRQFCTLARSVLDNSTGWPSQVTPMLDAVRWNPDRLTEDGKLRRPSVNLWLDLNQRGNLVMEWEPYSKDPWAVSARRDGDYLWFREWSMDWGWPANRILRLDEWRHLANMAPQDHTPAEKMLLDSSFYLVDEVKLFLEDVVDFHISSMIYRGPVDDEEWEAGESTRAARVLTAEQIAELEERKARHRWLGTFGQKGRPTVEELLGAYADAGSFAGASRILRSEYRISVGATAKYIRQLHSEFPDLYARHCDKPPPPAKTVPPVDFTRVIPLRPDTT